MFLTLYNRLQACRIHFFPYAFLYSVARRVVYATRDGALIHLTDASSPRLGLGLLDKNLGTDQADVRLFFCTCFSFQLDLNTYPLWHCRLPKHRREWAGRKEVRKRHHGFWEGFWIARLGRCIDTARRVGISRLRSTRAAEDSVPGRTEGAAVARVSHIPLVMSGTGTCHSLISRFRRTAFCYTEI